MFSFFKKSPMKQLSDKLKNDDEFFISYMVSSIDRLMSEGYTFTDDQLINVASYMCAYPYLNREHISPRKLDSTAEHIYNRYYLLTSAIYSTIN